MIVDRDVREMCQRNFSDHISLEAGAGSGKTATLIARILAWCLDKGWDKAEKERVHLQAESIALFVVERVVAITFTEAAAEEMSDRLGKALISLSRLENLDENAVSGFYPHLLSLELSILRTRAQYLLGVVDQMRIGTIHAFCKGILNRYPLEAQLHPSFIIDADGGRTEDVIQQILIKELHRQLTTGRPDAPLRVLFSDGIQSSFLQEHLQSAVDGTLCEDSIFCFENLKPTYEHIIETIDAVQPYFEAIKITKRSVHQHAWTELAKLADVLRQGLSLAQEFDKSTDCAWLKAHQEDLIAWSQHEAYATARLRDWSTKSKFPNGIDVPRLNALCDDLRRYVSKIRYYKPWVLQQGYLALQQILPKIRSELRKQGIQSFSSLLQETVSLFRKHPSICDALRGGMDLLLVDEFQDTSADQCEIIAQLGLSAESEYPKLFIVGDPKQSIYGWRSADIASYFSFAQRVESFDGVVKGCSLRLTSNFRSVPVIIQAVEQVFTDYMLPVHGFQPHFAPLFNTREADFFQSSSDIDTVEFWNAWPEESCLALEGVQEEKQAKKIIAGIKNTDALDLESRALAKNLLYLHTTQGVPWKECAVLFRSTTQLDTFLNVFKEYGIPYYVTRDKNYFRRREIIEIVSLLRCIVDPLDQISLLSVLRSSMVGLPDAALFLLWRHGFPEFIACVEQLSWNVFIDRERRLFDRLRDVDEIAASVPGYEHISCWRDSFRVFIRAIRQLRNDLYALPSDAFVLRLREFIGFELSESLAYQGNYRLANLERFFYSLQCTLEEDNGDWTRLLMMLQRAIERKKDGEEARPIDLNQDAVQILTIHKAKGLDFEHVYIMEGHRKPPPFFKIPFLSRRLPSERGETVEFSFLGLMTLGSVQYWEKRKKVSQYELVRLLYVAMTRAKNRLVLSGCFPAVLPLRNQEKNACLVDHLCSFFASQNHSILWDTVEAGRSEKRLSESMVMRFLGRSDWIYNHREDADTAYPTRKQLIYVHHRLKQLSLPTPKKSNVSCFAELLPPKEQDYHALLEAVFIPFLKEKPSKRREKQLRRSVANIVPNSLWQAASMRSTVLFDALQSFPFPKRECIWLDRKIEVDGLTYRIQRLDKKEDEYYLVEYVLLDSVYVDDQHLRTEGLIRRNVSTSRLHRICAFLNESLGITVKPEFWLIRPQKILRDEISMA
ncbi:MAG: UvrD-helicase domain-containing protein [Myxococcota bacterium]|nr:UvrD-helicase domain-containing protein [Myxococcota bacterium]